MSMNLETHKAPRPQLKPRPELPPFVRNYLEHVRGNPEISSRVPIDYLDKLWSQATEFARRNGVDCPIHREELEALRVVVEARVTASQARLLEQEILLEKTGLPSLSSARGLRQRGSLHKALRHAARDLTAEVSFKVDCDDVAQ